MKRLIIRYVSEDVMLSIAGRNYSGFYIRQSRTVLINTAVPEKARRYVLMHEKIHHYVTSFELIAYVLAAILAPISFLYYVRYLRTKRIKAISK